MDIFGLIVVPTWLVLLLTVVFLLWRYSAYELRKLKRIGLPGPRPIPFLGNMVAVMKKGMNPIQLEWVKQYGSIFGVYFGNSPIVWISDLEILKRIFIQDFATFQSRGNLIDVGEPFMSSLIGAEGNHWKYMRSILSPTFSSGKLRQMIPVIQRCSDVLVEHIKENGKDGQSLEMKRMFGAYTMDVISGTAFGIDVDSQKNPDDPFVKNADKLFADSTFVRPALLIALMFPFLKNYFKYIPFFSVLDRKPMNFFSEVTREALKERRKEGSNRRDFLQLMLDAHKESLEEVIDDDETENGGQEKDFLHYKQQGLSDCEILGNALIFFIAGFETTATTLTFTAHFLATNPKCQDKLLEEVDRVIGKSKPNYDALKQMEYMDMVISETLRHYPPATATQRSPTSDVTVNGFQIPRDMIIFVPVLAIHKDPTHWPDPETFDPERFTKENQNKRHPMAFLPFGAGPRNCIGMRLAKMEAKMALAAILKDFRFAVAPETEVPPLLDTGNNFLRAKNGVWVKFVSRN